MSSSKTAVICMGFVIEKSDDGMPVIDRGKCGDGGRRFFIFSRRIIISFLVMFLISYSSILLAYLFGMPILKTNPPSEEIPARIAWTEHEPIWISDDKEFVPENGVIAGTGTYSDPYIIAGWEIRGSPVGIDVSGTTAYFIIRDCYIHDCEYYGIFFEKVRNGRVYDTICSENYIGIYLQEARGCVISNNDCSVNFFEGITLDNAVLATVSTNDCSWPGIGSYPSVSCINITNSIGITVTDNICVNDYTMYSFLTYGIKLLGSSSIYLKNNTCCGNDCGIYQWRGFNTQFVDNNCSYSYYGIYYYGGSRSTITGNNCSQSSYNGINIDQSNNISISENICNYLGLEGIYISDCQDIDILNNSASHCNGNGIWVQSSERCLISNNTCCYQTYLNGITIRGTYSSTISNNNCSYNCDDGIYLEESDYNYFQHNNCSHNKVGIMVNYHSDYNDISSNNYISNEYVGIVLIDSDYNYIRYNVISHNCHEDYGYGIYISEDSDCNIIHENWIADNSRYGVYIDSSSCTNNEIYLNAFIGNNGAGSNYDPSHVQAYDDGFKNLWYSQYDNLGNYWSDWTSPDNWPPRGIVDLPYDVKGSDSYSTDFFPLAENPLVWIPEPPAYILIGLMLTIFLLMQRKGKKTIN